MEMNYAKTVEKWGTLEVAVKGPKEGNPFCDQWIKGTFECKNEKKTVDGFYDGDGVYKVRFMPSFVDTYTFKIESSFQTESAEEVSGSFEAVAPSADNHGPVRVAWLTRMASLIIVLELPVMYGTCRMKSFRSRP